VTPGCVLPVRRDTFKNVGQWLQEIRENTNGGEKMVIMLVGNKCDKETRCVGIELFPPEVYLVV
jgi:GTPase SAR1 family protein